MPIVLVLIFCIISNISYVSAVGAVPGPVGSLFSRDLLHFLPTGKGIDLGEEGILSRLLVSGFEG